MNLVEIGLEDERWMEGLVLAVLNICFLLALF